MPIKSDAKKKEKKKKNDRREEKKENIPKLGKDDRRQPHRLLAVQSNRLIRTRRGCIYAERVEPVAVQVRLDDVAVARVLVLGHVVHVQLPDELVAPGVGVEVKHLRLPPAGVPDGGAAVAGRREQVPSRREGRQVLVVLHAGPGDEQVRVGGVDGVGAGRHVADQRLPVVVEVGAVPRLAELVAQRQAQDVGVGLGPAGDVRQPALPVLDVKVHVAEPGVAVNVAAAPLGLVDVHVRDGVDAALGGGVEDVAPELEARRLRRPARVVLEDLVRDARAVGVAQRGERNLQRHVLAVALVDLVHHLRCVAEADHVEAHAGDAVQDLLGGLELEALGDHGLTRHGPVDAREGEGLAAGVDNVPAAGGKGRERPSR